MHRPALRQRVLASVAATQRLLGRHGPQGHVEDGPGWVAAVVPELTDASLVNAIVILDPRAVADALQRMRSVYAEAGIERWGVLLSPTTQAVHALQEAGLIRGARPTAMAAILDDLPPAVDDHARRSRRAGLLAQPVNFRAVGRINDLAYGHTDDRMRRLIENFPPDAARIYHADYEHEPSSVALVTDHNDDAAVTFVATVPWAQNQGLARMILSQALVDARERGATTSTLIASSMGRSTYASLGYHDVGALELWETAASGPA